MSRLSLSAAVHDTTRRLADFVSPLMPGVDPTDVAEAIDRCGCRPALEGLLATAAPPCVFLTLLASSTGEESGKLSDRLIASRCPPPLSPEALSRFYVLRSTSAAFDCGEGTMLEGSIFSLREGDLLHEVLVGCIDGDPLTGLLAVVRDVVRPALADGRDVSALKASETDCDRDRFERALDVRLREVTDTAIGAAAPADGLPPIRIQPPVDVVEAEVVSRSAARLAATDLGEADVVIAVVAKWAAALGRERLEPDAAAPAVVIVASQCPGGPRGIGDTTSGTDRIALREAVHSAAALRRDGTAALTRRARANLSVDVLEPDGPLHEAAAWAASERRASELLATAANPSVQSCVGTASQLSPEAARGFDDAVARVSQARCDASDAARFVSSLEPALRPLYAGSLPALVEAMPVILHQLFLLHNISPAFRAGPHSERILTRLTAQLVRRCKVVILSEGPVWAQATGGGAEVGRLISVVRCALDAGAACKREFGARDFPVPVNDLRVFGKLDLFSKRLEKVLELLSTMATFIVLDAYALDGIGGLVKAFFTAFGDFRSRCGDPLDHTKPAFDRDYAEFKKKIADTDCALQVYVNTSFENVPSTPAALQLLRKFGALLRQETLRSDLRAKYGQLFHRFGGDIEAVQRSYESEKHSPPVSRHVPPVAGRVLWSRHLLRRIEVTMGLFQATAPHVVSQSRKVVSLFNRVAAALVEFETFWLAAWQDAIAGAASALQATVVVVGTRKYGEGADAVQRDSAPGSTYVVNFDPALHTCWAEARWLVRLGCDIGPTARAFLSRRNAVGVAERLKRALARYDESNAVVHPDIRPALSARRATFERVVAPGLGTITWSCLGLEAYVAEVEVEAAAFSELVTRVADVLLNRVHRPLHTAALASIVDLSDEPMGSKDFEAAFLVSVRQRAVEWGVRSGEVRESVMDLCQLVAPGSVVVAESSSGRSNSRRYVAVEFRELSRLYLFVHRSFFKALLAGTVRSLQDLKTRLSVSTSAVDNTRSLLEATVVVLSWAKGAESEKPCGREKCDENEFTAQCFCFDPSPDELLDLIHRCVAAIVGCARDVAPWPNPVALPNSLVGDVSDPTARQLRKASALAAKSSGGVSILHLVEPAAMPGFHRDITRSGEVIKGALLVTGAALSVQHQMRDFRGIFLRFAPLFEACRREEMRRFAEAGPSGAGLEVQVVRFADHLAAAGALPEVGNVGSVRVSLSAVKQRIAAECGMWIASFALLLRLHTAAVADASMALAEARVAGMSGPMPEDIADVPAEMSVIQKTRADGVRAMADAHELEGNLPVIATAIGIVTATIGNNPEFQNLAAAALLNIRFTRRLATGEVLGQQKRRGSQQWTESVSGGCSESGEAQNQKQCYQEAEQWGEGQVSGAVVCGAGATVAIAMLREKMEALQQRWSFAMRHAETRHSAHAHMAMWYRREMVRQVQTFTVEVNCFRNQFEAFGPGAPSTSPSEAIDRLQHFQRTSDDKMERWQRLAAAEEMFNLLPTSASALRVTATELVQLHKLYAVYRCVMRLEAAVSKALWRDFDVKSMTAEAMVLRERCRKLPSTVRKLRAYADAKASLDRMNEVSPVLELLCTRTIRERHWREVMSLCGETWDLDPEVFSVSNLLKSRVVSLRAEVADIALASEKQGELENRLRSIAREWRERELSFAEFKNRGYIMLKGDETAAMREQLDEALVILSSILASRYCGPFRSEAQAWTGRLSAVADTLSLWVEVQSLWMYLEAVFGTGDIGRQLPTEAKRFNMVDKLWGKMMGKANDVVTVVDFCDGNDFLKGLPYLRDQLEICQRALSAYLEQKRYAFPRFFFISDGVLLEVLSLASDPTEVQQHLHGIFDGVEILDFDDGVEDPQQSIGVGVTSLGGHVAYAVAMRSSCGERLRFVEPVRCAGPIEEWLMLLLDAMRSAVQSAIRRAIEDRASLQGPLASTARFLFDHPAQLVALVTQIVFTADVTQALSVSTSSRGLAERRDVSRWLSALREVLFLQSGLTAGSKTQGQRIHLQNMTTLLIHKQDLWDGGLKKARDANVFQWIRQCRYYWIDPGRAELRIADAEIAYCDEFVDVRERLVLTPLTDRCYIGLSQAVALRLGGCATGPAGTGKTETVKDIARAAGKYVVVFNCSEEFDVKGTGRIFKGLAMSGSWGCFDEFNRISLPVLSVGAQQIQTVFTALKRRKHEFTFADGTVCGLESGVGIFITMNPTYAGRQELPENMKSLFRSVAMMVPDKQAIARVKLATAGYRQDSSLARKIDSLFSLCAEQLSPQKHYDFGLRSILSVLKTAAEAISQEQLNRVEAAAASAARDRGSGEADTAVDGMATEAWRPSRDEPTNILPDFRAIPPETEEAIIVRVLRSMNVARLLHEDVPIFIALLADHFPVMSGAVSAAMYRTGYESEDSIVSSIKATAPIHVVTTGPFIEKCRQLHESALVRHGIMVVGPAASGKTTIISTLLRAASRSGKKHRETRLHPKAVSASQLFGRVDPSTGDWFDGVLSSQWRKANKDRGSSVWIVCDGPIDTLWVESLNTVLDDNKLLTLPNGDRLPMAPSVRLCFELDSLRNASPATVSRTGMVYVSVEEIGWKPVAEGRIHGFVADRIWSQSFGVAFTSGLTQHFDAMLNFCRDEMIQDRATPQIAVDAVLSVACPYGQVISRCGRPGVGFDVSVERVLWFSLAWGVAGSFKGVDRAKVALWMQQYLPDLPTQNSIFELCVAVGNTANGRAVSATRQDGEATAMESLIPTLPTAGVELGEPAEASPLSGWVPWERLVPEQTSLESFGIKSPEGQPGPCLADYFIPTADNIAVAFLIRSCFSLHRPAMIVGVTGSGKSATAGYALQAACAALDSAASAQLSRGKSSRPAKGDRTGHDESIAIWKRMNLNKTTTASQLQGIFESSCEKRMGATFGPKHNKRLAFLIDDLHLADHNEWGDRPVCELLRQIVEWSGYFALERLSDWRRLVDLQYFSATRAPCEIPARLRRHFLLIRTSIPPDEALTEISSKIIGARFSPLCGSHSSSPGSCVSDGLIQNVACATVHLWSAAQKKLKATPQTPHYGCSLHQLFAILQGIVAADGASLAPEGNAHGLPPSMLNVGCCIASLWCHETDRIIRDCLATADDISWYDSVVNTAVSRNFPQGSEAVAALQRALIAFTSIPSRAWMTYGSSDGSACSSPSSEDGGMVDSEMYLTGLDAVQLGPLGHGHVLPVVPVRLNKLTEFLNSALTYYNNERAPQQGPFEMVLFRDAVANVLRVARVLSIPRGNAVMVGTSGCGRRSAARLAAYCTQCHVFEPHFTPAYALQNWCDDVRSQCMVAATQKPVAFLVTEAVINSEQLLDVINSILASGDLSCLYNQDDKDAAVAAMRAVAKTAATKHAFGGKASAGMGLNLSDEFLFGVFRRRFEVNIHFVMSIAAEGDVLRHRIRSFPALFTASTVIWVVPWPMEALKAVGAATIEQMMGHWGATADRSCSLLKHDEHFDPAFFRLAPCLAETCARLHLKSAGLADRYFIDRRIRVHVTPKLYLRFLGQFRSIYDEKAVSYGVELEAYQQGLQQLKQAEVDVKEMRVLLDRQETRLMLAREETELLLMNSEKASVEAAMQRENIASVTNRLAADAAVIGQARKEAEHDLMAAQPALQAAIDALEQITPGDMKTLKALKMPPEMVRRIFDGVCILLQEALDVPRVEVLAKGRLMIGDSWRTSGRQLVMRMDFLETIMGFNSKSKDRINDETVEFLAPYLRQHDFNFERARSACGNVAGLCTWVRAMVTYREMTKYVAPKIDALEVAERRFATATGRLEAKRIELAKAEANVRSAVNQLDEAKVALSDLENEAESMRNRMTYATSLLDALADERVRWRRQRLETQKKIECLTGDCIAAAAVVSYAGPLSAEYRVLLHKIIETVLGSSSIACSPDSTFISFLSDEETMAEWRLLGLPPDDQSAINAIIISRASHVPLLVDPQCQARAWLGNVIRESRLADSTSTTSDGVSDNSHTSSIDGADNEVVVCGTDSARMSSAIVNQMARGGAVIVEEVESVDGFLGGVIAAVGHRMQSISRQKRRSDPQLTKSDRPESTGHPSENTAVDESINRKSRNFVGHIHMFGEIFDHDSRFALYLVSTASKTELTPEAYSAVAVLDFSVTRAGLEQQMLVRLLEAERPELEQQKEAVLRDIHEAEVNIHQCERELLQKLSQAEGGLVDDLSLILTLARSKEMATDIKDKLVRSKLTRETIDKARRVFQPVAVHATLLYFVSAEISEVSAAYGMSLERFALIFDMAIRESPESPVASARVKHIKDEITWIFFRFVDGGLYTVHKTLFSLLLALRIEEATGCISRAELDLFLSGGDGCDISFDKTETRGDTAEHPVPSWFPSGAAQNLRAVLQYATSAPLKALAQRFLRDPAEYRDYIEADAPETLPLVEHFERTLSAFQKLAVIRCLRPDRTVAAAVKYVSHVLGHRFTKPPPIDLQSIASDSHLEKSSRTPVIFLLVPGSDPTAILEQLAKRKRRTLLHAALGQGQEDKCMAVLHGASQAGHWVVFHNAHLSTPFLRRLQDWIAGAPQDSMSFDPSPDYSVSRGTRVWLTLEPIPGIPCRLLQRSVKISMEPPSGMKPVIQKSFDQSVTPEMFGQYSRIEWRPCLAALIYLHAALLQRKTYGTRGWTMQYAFTDGDMQASLSYLQSHFLAIGDDVKRGDDVAWEGLRTMIGDIHYGGRVSAARDRAVLAACAESVFSSKIVCGHGIEAPIGLSKRRIFIPDQHLSYQDFRTEFADRCDQTCPSICGLASNAEFAKATRDSNRMLTMLMGVMPPHTGTTENESQELRSEVVGAHSAISGVLSKMPLRICDQKIERLLGRSCPALPMDVFMAHEMRRLNFTLNATRNLLEEVRRVVNGGQLAVLDSAVEQSVDCLLQGRIPPQFGPVGWPSTSTSASGSASIGQWLASAAERQSQLLTYCEAGTISAYWLGGFYRPAAFLHALRQERTRLRPEWSVDRVFLRYDVCRNDSVPKTSAKSRDFTSSPDSGKHSETLTSTVGLVAATGVFLRALSLDGASFDRHRMKLRQPSPRELSCPLPLVHVVGSFEGSALRTVPKPTVGSPVARTAQPVGASRLIGDTASALGWDSPRSKTEASLYDPGIGNQSPSLLSPRPPTSSHTGRRPPPMLVKESGVVGFCVGQDKEKSRQSVKLPLFATASRQTSVGEVELPHDETDTAVWTLRGAAVLCSLEE